ncbi:hypothetical protein R1flu_003067 [Riccia fluitans]|uniref:HTH CENPB-type domain-containing protein n=1 Tax=Riccia fluitans TaxID=41844 RepID=A0ABD1YBD3_9MARC
MISGTTVSKIIKDSSKWLNMDFSLEQTDVKHHCPAKWPGLEKALIVWFNQMRARNAYLSEAMLKEKAESIAKLLNHENFQASEDWVRRFKLCHQIETYVLLGEAGDASTEGIRLAKESVPKLIRDGNYEPEDVFNFDETGLFFRARPSRTLAKSYAAGQKSRKERITLGLCNNILGREKWMPVVITSAKRPRCFGKIWQPSSVSHYFFNKKAWMTSEGLITTEEYVSLARENDMEEELTDAVLAEIAQSLTEPSAAVEDLIIEEEDYSERALPTVSLANA